MDKRIFLDTTVFFDPKKNFLEAISNGWKLHTSSIVIYEFYKIIAMEIHKAQQKHKKSRTEKLKSLEGRFVSLLENININILQISIDPDYIIKTRDIQRQYELDFGDALNYLIMKDNNLTTILSSDKDWNRVSDITNIVESSEFNPSFD